MKNNIKCLFNLVGREIKLFLKDKASVFFSLLSPLIILLLYLLFLGDTQVSVVENILANTGVEEKLIKSFIDGWMLAGVVSVACITVSFSAYNVVLSDKENGVLDDIMSSPVERWVVNTSYFIYNFLVTLFICTILLVIVFVYLIITGWYLSTIQTLAIIGNLVLSVLSASLVSTAICSFLKTVNAHSACVGILSAVSGFLIGAYMPLSMFPKAVQYIVLFVPGTYSAGIFRNLFMSGVLEEIGKTAPYHIEPLKENYSMYIDFFGEQMESNSMLYAMLVMIVLFVVINVVIFALKPKFARTQKLKKRISTK